MHLHSGLQGHASPKPRRQSVVSISIQGRREECGSNTLLKGQPGEDEQSRNSTIQLYLCVRMSVREFLFKDIIMKELFEASCNFIQTACGQHMACVVLCCVCICVCDS